MKGGSLWSSKKTNSHMHGVAPPSSAAAAAQTHSGLLDPYSKHRKFNEPICRGLSHDWESLDLAKAIANCSTALGLEIEIDEDQGPKAHLRAAGVCNRRLCPFCEWRRVRAWRRRFFEGLPSFHDDFPTHKPLFLTLTVKNCPITELRSQIGHMHRSFNRMQKLSAWPTTFWFRRTEITLQGGQGKSLPVPYVHPHLHVLLFVPADYFGRNYVKQTEWQKQWMMAARLDYPPVVDVRAATSKSTSGGPPIEASKAASLEAAKYGTKATDLIAMGSHLGEYNRQVRGLRLSQASKSLKLYLADGPPSAEELVDQEPVGDGPLMRAKALWFDDIQEYLFTEID